MGTAQVVFAVERCSGATGSYVTGSDVSHMTEVTTVIVRKYVLRMPNRKLRHIRPSVFFWQEVTKSRGRNGPCPEVALTGSRFCACPVFSPRLFLRSSKMATGCDRRSLDPPSGFPWVWMRNRKLRNTRSSSKQCWLGCSLRRPRHVTGRGPVRKGPGPEVCSAHAPFFPPRFFP
jgi:hypothetical protein